MIDDSIVFKMPTIGIDLIRKVIGAYAARPDSPSTLDAISEKSGVNKSDVSLNAGFLVSLGVISKGKSKSLTEDGKNLAFSIIHRSEEEERSAWRRLLQGLEAVESLTTYVRLADNVKIEDFQKRIKTNLKLSGSRRTTTGVNCFIDILKHSNIIEISDGIVKLSQPEPNKEINNTSREKKRGGTKGIFDPNININIQIHISPDASKDQIELVFTNMKKLFSEWQR